MGSKAVVGSRETMMVVMGSGVTAADSEKVVSCSLGVEVGCDAGEVTSEGVAVGSSLTVNVSDEVRTSEDEVVNWNVNVSVVAEVVFENVSVGVALAVLVLGAEEVTLEKREVCKMRNHILLLLNYSIV